ncbi:MAG: hypothetical protein GF375_05185 [Candidatus Omnitrophica bacterium]|nr:hypothetical protein [Candidatus Omnitrophota bacterium]MBD3269386.1 hypothetical protein [Candidatus Omnitrophota bacterium]
MGSEVKVNTQYVPLSELLKATDGSIYKLAILLAKRGIELADGQKPLIDKPDERVLNTALAEIKEGLVKVLDDGKKKREKGKQ